MPLCEETKWQHHNTIVIFKGNSLKKKKEKKFQHTPSQECALLSLLLSRQQNWPKGVKHSTNSEYFCQNYFIAYFYFPFPIWVTVKTFFFYFDASAQFDYCDCQKNEHRNARGRSFPFACAWSRLPQCSSELPLHGKRVTTKGTVIGSSGTSSRSSKCSNTFGLLWVILKTETMEELSNILNLAIAIIFFVCILKDFFTKTGSKPSCCPDVVVFLWSLHWKITHKDFGYSVCTAVSPFHRDIYIFFYTSPLFFFPGAFPVAAGWRWTTPLHTRDSQPRRDSHHFLASVIKKLSARTSQFGCKMNTSSKNIFFSQICC